MSRSSRRPAFSRRRRRTSSSSDLPSCGTDSACLGVPYFFRQTCKRCGWTSRSRATCVSGRFPSATRPTASRLNSLKEWSCFPIIPRRRFFADAIGVSGEPGKAQPASSSAVVNRIAASLQRNVLCLVSGSSARRFCSGSCTRVINYATVLGPKAPANESKSRSSCQRFGQQMNGR